MRDYLGNKIILAPMGGGPGTPELAAAVSNAGGLGSFAAGYLTPQQILDTAKATRALTDRPFNINLFAGGYATEMNVDPRPMLEIMSEIHAKLGLPAPVLPPLQPNPFPEQLEAVLEARPAVFSFTFGVPSATDFARLKAKGIATLGTATTATEARILKDAGVDAIVAQGAEAGAHRGTFNGSFEDSMAPTLDLVKSIAPFAPVIASGGIMDATDVAKMLAAGAIAVQMGTAFLTCPEAGTAKSWRDRLLAATTDTTVITRAFSGRHARGLRNTFIDLIALHEKDILPFPVQNTLTRTMRAAGCADYQSLWAGQGVAKCRQLPARDLIEALIRQT
jgi:nitronate monooxygenase